MVYRRRYDDDALYVTVILGSTRVRQVKDLNAAKAKAPYKTVDDVDDRIK